MLCTVHIFKIDAEIGNLSVAGQCFCISGSLKCSYGRCSYGRRALVSFTTNSRGLHHRSIKESKTAKFKQLASLLVHDTPS